MRLINKTSERFVNLSEALRLRGLNLKSISVIEAKEASEDILSLLIEPKVEFKDTQLIIDDLKMTRDWNPHNYIVTITFVKYEKMGSFTMI